MTREQYSRTLRHMEQLRLDSYETETDAQEKRMTREYARLWKIIEPYATGKQQFSDAMGRGAGVEAKTDVR